MDWLLEQEPGSESLIVAFTSYGEDGAPPTEHEWQGVLSPVRCHKLFLLDRNQHWYHSGVEGFSTDLASTAHRVREIASELNVSRIMTLGSSMAGYGALRVGGMVRADHVLALAPTTTINKEWRTKHGVTHRAVKTEEAQAVAFPDSGDVMHQFLMGRAPRTVRAIFDPENAHDRLQSERLKDMNPGYRLDMLPGAGHLVAWEMARSGDITRIARDWLSEPVAEACDAKGAARVIGAARQVEDAHAS